MINNCNCGNNLEKSFVKKDGTIIYKDKCRSCRGRKIDPIKQYEYKKEWFNKNRERELNKQKEWRNNNQDTVKRHAIKNREKRNIYYKQKIKTDINFKLTKYLRTRLYNAIKNNQKSGSAIKDLGCSILDLKKHLESKFQPNMTWDNYGEWHIDHIEPLSKYNLENREELLKVCHYSNLQPLWALDNLIKGKK